LIFSQTHLALYRPLGGNEPWFICLFWRYINCVFVYLFTFISFLLTFFFPYNFLLTYLLSTSCRIGPVWAPVRQCAMIDLLISALYKIFTHYIHCLSFCLLNFLSHFLSSLLFSFLMLLLLLIYFLTGLLPHLFIYSFQNRPVTFPGWRL